MKVLKDKQKQARKLRKRGFTHREIARKLHVAVARLIYGREMSSSQRIKKKQ